MWNLIIFGAIVIATVLLIKSSRKLKKRMKELNAETFLIAEHIEGLPIPQKTITHIFPCPDKLVFESKKGKFEIPNERIKKYKKLTEKEIIQSDKSVVGRAVVGGVLLGGLGALVGGMSGIGSKTKNKEHGYFVINYIDSNGDMSVVSFETNLNIDHIVLKFSEILNKSKGIEKIDPNKTTIL